MTKSEEHFHFTEESHPPATVRCRCCGGIATSTYRHHYAEVEGCPNHTAIDGGPDGTYQRFGGNYLSLIDYWVEDEGWVPLLFPDVSDESLPET